MVNGAPIDSAAVGCDPCQSALLAAGFELHVLVRVEVGGVELEGALVVERIDVSDPKGDAGHEMSLMPGMFRAGAFGSRHSARSSTVSG